MKFSRRDFLKLGGVTFVAVAGGVVVRAVDQGVFSVGKGIAYEPWTNWRDAGTAAERIVAAGILASNPHNSQPWLFRISDSSIDLFADRQRQIGAIDPFLREMYIGLGCAVENMMLAAEAEGFSPALQFLPDREDETHAAHIELTDASPLTSELYLSIPARHTDRGAYDTSRSVDPGIFDQIDGLVREPALRLFWFRDEAARAKFSGVANQSAKALIADEEQSVDSHAWWRQDWDQLQETADGITLDAQSLGPITPFAKILPDLPRAQNDGAFVKNIRETMLPTAAAFGILAVQDGMDNTQRLGCGRTWQRIHLWGMAQGLAFQPLNQMCERVDREAQLGLEPAIGSAVRDLLHDDAWHAVMPFRLGYPTSKTNASPRRGLEKVIV